MAERDHPSRDLKPDPQQKGDVGLKPDSQGRGAWVGLQSDAVPRKCPDSKFVGLKPDPQQKGDVGY